MRDARSPAPTVTSEWMHNRFPFIDKGEIARLFS